MKWLAVVLCAAACNCQPPPVVHDDAGDGGGTGTGGGTAANGGGSEADAGSFDCYTYEAAGGGAPAHGFRARLFTPPGSGDLRTVFARQNGDVLVGGDGNRLFQLKGGAWVPLTTGEQATARVLSVAAYNDTVVVLIERTTGERVALEATLDGGAFHPLSDLAVPTGAQARLLSRPRDGQYLTLAAADGGSWTAARLTYLGWESLGPLDAGAVALASGGFGSWSASDAALTQLAFEIGANVQQLSLQCQSPTAFFVYADPAGTSAALVTSTGHLCTSLHGSAWLLADAGVALHDVTDLNRFDSMAVGDQGVFFTGLGSRLICGATHESLRAVHGNWAVGDHNTVVRLDRF